MSHREKILARIPTIPGIPASTTRAMALARDPEADPGAIARLIEQDPGLTTNLLRLVNSPHYARSRSVSSVRQAVVLLGMHQVSQLVLALTIAPVAWHAVRGYDLPPGDLWAHFLGVATAVPRVASACGITMPEYTYTAALLHDIGKVVLGTFLEVDAGPIFELVARERIPFVEAERRYLGIDHPEAGAELLRTWHFPDEVVEVVRWHHEPERAEKEQLVASLVHVADLVCLQCGVGVGGDGLNYSVSPAATARLGIREDDLERVAADVLVDLEAVQKDYNVSTGGSRDGS